MRPDGTWPSLGDEDGGSVLRLSTGPVRDMRGLLNVGAGLFGSPEWIVKSGSQALAWWLLGSAEWTALTAMRPASPTTTAANLPDAGYFVAREDWSSKSWYCMVDAGPHGGDLTGHAHSDLGHVEIARGSDVLICDPGSLTYVGRSQHRLWHCSEAAHARPVIQDVPLAEKAGSFSWQSIAPDPQVSVHDDGRLWTCRIVSEWGPVARRVQHERQVALLRGMGVVVCDWLRFPRPTRYIGTGQFRGGPISFVSKWTGPIIRPVPCRSVARFSIGGSFLICT